MTRRESGAGHALTNEELNTLGDGRPFNEWRAS